MHRSLLAVVTNLSALKQFGRPSPRKGHSGSRQSWSYSYSWSETEGGVASGSNVHTIVESASEVVRTVTAPVRTQTAKVTATKQASTKNASKTHKKATATHKASSKKVKSTHKTSAQANATTRATYAASTTKKATTTTKKASSTVAATSTATASSALQSLSLKSHNAARSEYGAGALKWDADLVSLAQTWADGCVWAHGGANGAGQNLAVSWNTPETARRWRRCGRRCRADSFVLVFVFFRCSAARIPL